MIKAILLALLLIPVSCAKPVRVTPVNAMAPPTDEMVADAKDEEASIVKELPIYKADDISRYEKAEIAAVEDDIDTADAETDAGRKVEDVQRLTEDWETLVGLDLVLQKEHLI